MRKIFSLFSVIVLTFLILAVPSATAATKVDFAVAAAYPKSGQTYDVVVKETPGTRLALYVNDKNPTRATVNKKNWATFHRVALHDSDKISFTREQKQGSKKVERAVNYVRYIQAADTRVQFSKTAKVAQPQPASAPTPTPQPAPAPTPPPTPAPAPAPEPTCSNGSYANSAGNRVCSPEAAPSAPAGATAQCRDGTYSYSQSRSGTCSHHGGVASWL